MCPSPRKSSEVAQRNFASTSRPLRAKTPGIKLQTALVVAGLCALLWLADSVKERCYIFDPLEVGMLAQDALERYPNSTAGAIHHIATSLHQIHSSSRITADPFPSFSSAQLHIRDSREDVTESPLKDEWVFNNAGGAMGSMYILHASITEYLIIFGTAVGTEGHTGRHSAEDYFHVLQGELWIGTANSLVKNRYQKGSAAHLGRGNVAQYKLLEGTWGLELAQGWIPTMLPFGFADTITSTIDFGTFGRTLWITAREMVRNLLTGKV